MTPEELARFLLKFRHDPVGFAQVMFPWGQGLLKDFPGLLEWQINIAGEAAKVRPDRVVQLAVASGHGIGKSALTAILTLWMVSTFPDTRGVITANTETQLKTKTFAELSKWFYMSPLPEIFTLTATSMYAKDPEHEKTWRVDIVPWSERNPEAFAGLHNRGRRQFMIFDEASAISDVIFEVASGFLTDKETERLWLMFGNPTRGTGYFRECFPPDGRFRDSWTTRNIDSRTVPISDKDLIEQLVAQYGEDSDYIRVRVRGEFPLGNTLEFIPRDLARKAAQAPDPHGTEGSPLVMGVDVARSGTNDSAVVLRRGLNARIGAFRWNGASVVETAERVARLADRYQPDVILVDAGGVGGGVLDALHNFGYMNAMGVQFGSKPLGLAPGVRPLNRRVEMWYMMKEWLRNGGVIPDDDHLIEELCSPCQKVSTSEKMADYLMLESKQEMAARGAPSPDMADALALTFAVPSPPKGRKRVAKSAQTRYNPLGSELEAELKLF